MRRLVLLCFAIIAATSAYNLVIQEITLKGGLITSNTLTCENLVYLHIDGKSPNFDCFEIFTPDAKPPTLEARKIVYTDSPIQSKNTKFNCEIGLTDNSNVTFTFSPKTSNVGKQQTADTDGKYIPIPTTTIAPPATTATTPPTPECKDGQDPNNDPCTCPDKPEEPPGCIPKEPVTGESSSIKAVKKTIIRKPIVPVVAETTTVAPPTATDATMVMLPIGLRHRGPGPVRPPVQRPPVEDTVVNDEEDEKLRIKRDVDAGTTVTVSVTYYVLDEAGNSAAVWAAVIEGIILIVLVGACFYFFCWAPRSRAVGAASADPYKDGPNYTVSYANSSFNNQRIDAFQNPPAAPAAPARPANSSYMDDYITDNIAARPVAPAAPAASAANPVASDFRPGHQRFDSSGLVTVNLS